MIATGVTDSSHIAEFWLALMGVKTEIDNEILPHADCFSASEELILVLGQASDQISTYLKTHALYVTERVARRDV